MKGVLLCLLACTLIVGGLADISCLPQQGSMNLYLQGVWEQLALEYDWMSFKPQIDLNSSLDNDNLNLTGQGFDDLNINATNCTGEGCNQGPSDADIMVRGIQKLTQVINQRFSLAGDNFLEDYNQALIQKIIAEFTNQTGGTFTPKTSVIIQGVEVWSHINEAIVAWQNESWYNAGAHLGMAMGMVFWRGNVNSQDMVDIINANQSDWVAATYSAWLSTNLWTLKKAVLNSHEGFWANYTNGTSSLTPPAAYDMRNVSNCVHPIRDIQLCGSSWAMAAADVLADRFCLASNGVVTQQLSANYMLSCSGYNNGCQGGYNDRAWDFLENAGDASETCRPYVEGNGTWSNNCTAASTCADGSNAARYYAQVNSSKWFWGAESIKAEVWAHGPVETSFSVWQDFMHYRSGIYHHVTGDFVGVASARIVGWGNNGNGTNYWIAANYWGNGWGEDGYFRMKENDGEYLEYAAVAGIPDIRSCTQQ